MFRILIVIPFLCLASYAAAQRAVELASGLNSQPSLVSKDSNPARSGKGKVEIGWYSGKLSVNGEGAPLSAVLLEIAGQTGIDIQGAEGLVGEVSVHIRGAGLTEALRDILAHVNYAIVDESAARGLGGFRVIIFGERTVPDSGLTANSFSVTRGAASTGDSDNQDTWEQTTEGDQQEQSDPVKRMAALNVAIKQDNREALRQAVLDPDPTLQASAFEALAAKARTAATSALLSAVKSERAATRVESFQLLAQSHADEAAILRTLRGGLEDDDESVRTCAVEALANRPGAEAIGYLHQAFSDAEPSFKLVLVSIVAQRKEGVPILWEAVNDADESVRSTAEVLLQQAKRGLR